MSDYKVGDTIKVYEDEISSLSEDDKQRFDLLKVLHIYDKGRGAELICESGINQGAYYCSADRYTVEYSSFGNIEVANEAKIELSKEPRIDLFKEGDIICRDYRVDEHNTMLDVQVVRLCIGDIIYAACFYDDNNHIESYFGLDGGDGSHVGDFRYLTDEDREIMRVMNIMGKDTTLSAMAYEIVKTKSPQL